MADDPRNRWEYNPAPPPGAALSVVALTALKGRWYAEAEALGDLALALEVVRRLGCEAGIAGGAAHRWERGDVSVSSDDRGRHVTVAVGGQVVCRTHDRDRLFVPGRWLDVLRAAGHEARLVAEHERDVRERAQRDHAAERACSGPELGLSG